MLVFIQLSILIFSIVLHEIAHGYVAFKNGDPTAKQFWQDVATEQTSGVVLSEQELYESCP